MSSLFNNKNEKQAYFNQIRGEVVEVNETTGPYHNLTLRVGHEKLRLVNMMVARNEFDKLVTGQKILIGDRICARFYLKSKKRENGYYSTIACVLDIEKIENQA